MTGTILAKQNTEELQRLLEITNKFKISVKEQDDNSIRTSIVFAGRGAPPDIISRTLFKPIAFFAFEKTNESHTLCRVTPSARRLLSFEARAVRSKYPVTPPSVDTLAKNCTGNRKR